MLKFETYLEPSAQEGVPSKYQSEPYVAWPQWSHSDWPNRSQERRASFPTRLQGSKPLKDKPFFSQMWTKLIKLQLEDRRVEAKQ